MPTKTQPLEPMPTELLTSDELFYEEEDTRIEDLIAFRNSDEGKKLVSWVTSSYEEMNSLRHKERQQWLLNLAMYNGQHNTKILTGVKSANGADLFAPPVAKNSDKKVINRIRSTVRTEQAKFLSQKPGASVIPASSEDEDLFAAMAGEQIFQSLVARKQLQAEYAKAIFWLSITGNGFLKHYWDDNAEDEVSEVLGDIQYESVSPFNLFVPDLRQEDIEMQGYVMHMYTKPPEWVDLFYAEELAGESPSSGAVTANSLLEDSYLKTTDNDSKSSRSGVMIYEMWVKPGAHKSLPKGGLVTVAGNVLVGYSNEGLPYKHNKYPFSHMKHIPSGKFYATSVIEDLIELNRDYNDVRTHIARARKRTGMAQFVAQKGSVSPAKWTNETGLLIEYKPGTPPPTAMPIPNLPSYILQEPDRILQDIEDISGQHQVSKGSAPPGVTAATAISFLQEKDDSYLVPTYQSIEAAFEKLGRCSLALAVQYWDIARTIKVVGTDNSFDAYQFTGAEIANGMDLRVEPGSALPQSKAAKQAFILDLMKMGFIPPEKGLEILEIGGAQKMLDQLQGDKKQAQRENVKMKSITEQDINAFNQAWQQAVEANAPDVLDQDSGEPLNAPPLVPVNTYDNHAVHIEVHNTFRRSQAFEFLPDFIKEIFETHVEQHKLAQQSDMLQQLLSQIPSDGTVPGMMGEAGEEEAGGEMGAPGEESSPPMTDEMPSGDAMAPTEEVI